MASRGLGTLTLSLVVQMGGFTKPLDQAGRALSRLEQRANAAGKKIGLALKVGFGIGSAALGLYIRNTIEAEKVQAQLISRITDTAGAAGRSLQQLNAQAQKLQSLTVFDDEAIGTAQAALLTFTQISGLNFDRTIEAATDLATVMGTDVADAAKVLGKALSDPEKGIGALRKAGVTLTEDQKALVKSFQDVGDIAGAQGVILDALAGKMGTAAEAARNTLGGALEAAKNAFNNMLEGDSGDAGVRGATEAINNLAASMNSEGVRAGFDTILTGLAKVAQFALDGIEALNGNSQAARDNAAANAQKSYIGLLQRRFELEDELGKNFLQRDVQDAFRSDESIRKELAEVGRLEAAYRGAGAAKATVLGGTPFRSGETQVIHGGFSPLPTATGGGGRSNGQAERDAQRQIEEQARRLADAYTSVNDVLEAQAKLTGGPALDAAIDYREALVTIQEAEDELGKQGKLDADQQARIAQARDQAAEAYQNRITAIENTLTPLQELIKSQERELELLGLTGPALQTASDLYGASAEDIARFGDQVRENNERLEENRQAISAMDEFRRTFENSVVDVLTGAKSISDAFKSMADQVIQQITRIIAQQLTSSLFGEPGTSGTGSSGGWISAAFNALIGGRAHAAGTDFAPGGMSLVGERGPEIVNLPRGSSVTPNHKLGGTSIVININGNATKETAQYAANQVARKLAFAGRG